MKIYNLRKYIFLNITAFLSYFFWIVLCMYWNINLPPYNDELITPGFEYRAKILILSIIIFVSFILAIIEITIRILLKKYWHIQLNLNLNLPKLIDMFYSIVFIIGTCLAILPILIVTILLYSSLF